MKKPLLACVFALSCLPFAAQAEPSAVGARTVIDFLNVTYGDLNLSNRAGAETLYGRIRFAATRVCGGVPDIREIRERRNFKACVGTATGDAVRQVDAPLVTALFFQDKNIEYATASRW